MVAKEIVQEKGRGGFVEVGKKTKRKVEQGVGHESGDGDDIPYAALVKALRKLSDQMKENCMKDARIPRVPVANCAMSNCSEFDRGDDICSRLAPPAQEDADKTPCGQEVESREMHAQI